MSDLKPDQLQTDARKVTARLQQAGHTAFWAGGCVRDILMGRQPKDYDIATSALPDQVLQLFPHAITVGKSFGVVRVPWHGHHFEIATFRRDFSYRDGRRPDFVVFADAVEDAQRRDFTINAIFYDPVAAQWHDFVDGRRDLKAGVIRAVGDPAARFKEDHLRMLRAIRFAATLNFKLDEATARAITTHAESIKRISAERIQIEITRSMLESPRAGEAIRQMEELGLMQHIMPEVSAMRGQEQPPQFHPEGDVFTHTVLMLNAMNPQPPLRLAWAALLHDVGKPPTCRVTETRLRFNGHAAVGAKMAAAIMNRLRMSKDDTKAVSFCIANHMRFMEVQRMKRSTLLRLIGAETFPLELELHRLDCLASHGDLDNYNFLQEFIRARAAEPVLPPPLITGHDIISLGIHNGPEIGHWKKAAYEAQLNNLFADYDAAMEWLRQQISSTASLAHPQAPK